MVVSPMPDALKYDIVHDVRKYRVVPCQSVGIVIAPELRKIVSSFWLGTRHPVLFALLRVEQGLLLIEVIISDEDEPGL